MNQQAPSVIADGATAIHRPGAANMRVSALPCAIIVRVHMNAPTEKEYISEVVRRIARECPRRQGTSEDERRAHEIIRREFEDTGLGTSVHEFRFNDNIHANLILHFGMAVVATALLPFAPLVSLVLYALAVSSYWADSTRRAYILRRAFPFKRSQNVLGTVPARAEPKLRIVFLSHIDAAFTGLVFHPWLLERMNKDAEKKPRFLRRPTELAMRTLLVLTVLALVHVLFGAAHLWLRVAEAVLILPSLLMTLANTDILLRNQVVPGANDDLSGVASLPVLARRLMKNKHPDVELVFVATGCEETSLGGADALARDRKGVWDQKNTVVLALDGLAMGELRYLEAEGEVSRIPTAAWLVALTVETAATEERFKELRPFEIPVGGTDAAAFMAHGFEALGLVCVDPKFGAPRFYHRPDDNPDNLDVDKILFSLDFTEKLVDAIVRRRLDRA